MLGDGALVGEGAVVFGDEGVGAEAAHAVWGCAADVGKEDVTSLVAAGILKLTPVSDPEHVTGPVVCAARKVDNSRFIILQSAVKGFLFSIFFPVI